MGPKSLPSQNPVQLDLNPLCVLSFLEFILIPPVHTNSQGMKDFRNGLKPGDTSQEHKLLKIGQFLTQLFKVRGGSTN